MQNVLLDEKCNWTLRNTTRHYSRASGSTFLLPWTYTILHQQQRHYRWCGGAVATTAAAADILKVSQPKSKLLNCDLGKPSKATLGVQPESDSARADQAQTICLPRTKAARSAVVIALHTRTRCCSGVVGWLGKNWYGPSSIVLSRVFIFQYI